MVEFILNNQSIKTSLAAGSTVLDFVRYQKRLMGTKIGCREGDCGACTVLVGGFENKKLVYRSYTSCLMPLANAQGKHIVTVEGINSAKLSPVQQAMVDTNGTQCGFCTIGFVMSLTGFVLNDSTKKYEEAIAAIDGNICRCTGYKSIERAAQLLTEQIAAKPVKGTTDWLVKNDFVPAYFLDIEERLKQINVVDAPAPTNGSERLMLGGATDLMVQKHAAVKKAAINKLFDAEYLKGIGAENGQVVIGASTTVTEISESPLFNEIFPQLQQYVKLISSTPIRNMATVGGNLVNASPIGDLSIFFLALDASLKISSNDSSRTIKLKDLYKGYKQLDKQPHEYIEKIIFTPPQANDLFSFEKVSKRTNLDIASVNSACFIRQNKAGEIEAIHLSAGGVAPFPKYLRNTVAFLLAKKIDELTVKEAMGTLKDEVAPISDARGTAAYKLLLLQQLFLAHIAKIPGTKALVKNILEQQATTI